MLNLQRLDYVFFKPGGLGTICYKSDATTVELFKSRFIVPPRVMGLGGGAALTTAPKEAVAPYEYLR